MIRSWLIAMALIVSGCSDSKPDTFTLHGKWTDSDKVVIQAAMDAWCDASDGEYCSQIGEGDSTLWLTSTLVSESGRYGIRSVKPEGASYIRVNVDDTADDWSSSLYATMLHELGHHWRGQGHLKPGLGVLAPCDSPRPMVVTSADVSQPVDRNNICNPGV